MLTEFVIKKIVDEFYANFKKKIGKQKVKSIASRNDIEIAITNYQSYIANWSKNISFNLDGKTKSMSEVYLDLEISLTAKKYLEENEEVVKVDSILEVITDKSFIILGDPGAGKTTTLQYLCNKLLYDETDALANFNFPLLIELRTLDKDDGIFSFLQRKLGIFIEHEDSENEKVYAEIIKNTIFDFLNDFKVLLLIDGLDEIDFKYEKIISEFRELVLNSNSAISILTCRSGAFNSIVQNCEIFELCPLDVQQISLFSSKWFKDKRDSSKFLRELKKSPYFDTALRPLFLTLLCTLYNKNKKIPEKPKSVYKRIIQLLLEEWDRDRDIIRENSKYSQYSQFDIDRKFDFLSRLAFQLTLLFPTKVYNSHQFLQAYDFIFEDFGLTSKESRKIVAEIESHNGIFVQAGYNGYQFSHKSIQEYLTANYIVLLPNVPENILFTKFKNEFAIAISLSSDPTVYFANIIERKILIDRPSGDDVKEFLVRLLLEKPDFSQSPVWLILVFYLCSLFLSRYKNENFESELTEMATLLRKIHGIEIYYQGLNSYYEQHTLKAGKTELWITANGSLDLTKYSLPNSISIDSDFLSYFEMK